MARFRMTYAFHYGSVKVAAGKTLADSVANSQAGDDVWTGLVSATVPRGAVALDASATSMLSTSPWASVTAWGAPTGVDSIGA
jgi:hypothetical protein